MPIYNNPAVGQAIGNLSSLFAPPSGSDAAGWAVANAKRAEAARLADVYAAAGPDLDRRAVAAGIYNPTQSYYAVDMGGATTRRGQDIGSADARYNVDVRATTSRANNEATVAGGITQARLGGLAGLYGPLNPGQRRPALRSRCRWKKRWAPSSRGKIPRRRTGCWRTSSRPL